MVVEKLRAFKFQLIPTEPQRRRMAQFAGCRRFAYNRALELQKEQTQNGGKVLGYADLCRRLTEWRHCERTAFLAEAPTHPLQQALKDLDRAFSNFFAGRAQFPRFRKRGRRDSFRYPDPKQIKHDEKNKRIFLPKLGWIRYRKSRETPGILKQVTVSRSGDAWYVSIQTEMEITVPESNSGTVVGIDLGIAKFATLSDGSKYVSEVNYRKFQARIAKEQRKLEQKVKLSANWHKQVEKIQRLYRRIFNCRRDFLHKTSTAICKNHAVVIIEDLNVKGMSTSASGTVENPGSNVQAKAGLNRSILNQSWGELRRQLEYKLQEAGGTLIAIPAKNTSLKCSKCGQTSKENRKTQSSFACVACKHNENADLNAARNILAAGLAVFACGRTPPGVENQEPTMSVSAFAYSASVLA